jgi:amino acid transporter
MGFLFGWAQLAVVLTSSSGAMAYVFATNAVTLWSFGPDSVVRYAIGAVAVLSLLNILGVVLGKTTQNLLTTAKVLGLGGILAAGVLAGGTSAFAAGEEVKGPGLGLAMILVLYAYGGWSDAAFVAAEVRTPKRNIPLALILGTIAITVVYVLINAAYLAVLGFTGVRNSSAVAADVFKHLPAAAGAPVMSVLVMISALGALNGLIFTSSRVYSQLGAEHSIFAWLGRWSPRLGSPVGSLVVQALITIGMIALVGTEAGQALVNKMLAALNAEAIPRERFRSGFTTLVSSTAPVFWLFFLLTGLSLFALRERDKTVVRPFSVPLYPVLPLIFCGMCLYMWFAAVDYAGKLGLLGWIPLLVGLPLYLVSHRRDAPEGEGPGGMAAERRTA